MKQSSAAYMLPMPARLRLVEQRLAERPVGLGRQAAHGLVLVPVGAEQVGAEVADDAALLGSRGEQLDDAEREADGDLVRGRRGPPGPGARGARHRWPGW